MIVDEDKNKKLLEEDQLSFFYVIVVFSFSLIIIYLQRNLNNKNFGTLTVFFYKLRHNIIIYTTYCIEHEN